MTGPEVEPAFFNHRRLLFTIAYEMLGSASDAEDVLQESWLKWDGVDQRDVRDPRAYLVRIVTRTALDRLRLVARRREEYVGPWLPEPLLTAPDVADDIVLAESLSMAMLLVLETLSPTERAVFVLREVFELGYDELAEAVGKTPSAVRQIAHRAREHVAARRPRGVTSHAETRTALDAFRRALDTGDLQGLVDILAPDVVVLADGGGGRRALPRPVIGSDKVGRLIALGVATARAEQLSVQLTLANGWPALVLRHGAEIHSVVGVDVEDGLVTTVYTMRNPDKLSRMGAEAPVSR